MMDDEQVCTAPDVPIVALMINCCSFTKFRLIRNSLSTEHRYTGWAKSNYTVIKNKVYERKPQTLDEMKEFITDAFMDIDSDCKLCRTVCQSVSDRLDTCCNVDGGHFEHLRH